MFPYRTAVAVVLLAYGPALADWPVFRGSPEMHGRAADPLPDQLVEKWTFKTGNAIEGAPAVVAGVVYVGSADKHLYAVELATGKLKWKTALGAPTKASPAVRDGAVYVGDSDGKLYAMNAADGAVKWTFEAMGEITGGVNFHAKNVLFGSHDGKLYCLDAAGKKQWEFDIQQQVNGAPAVAGDRTFVAGCDSVLHVVDATNGKEVAAVDLGGQAGATAAVGGDAVYVGTMSNQVVGVDWKAGKKTWAFEAARRQQPFYASAAVTDQLVVAGSRDKRVYALDRSTGKERWSFAAAGNVDASPVVAGGRVYVGSLSDEGNFYVLDLGTGRKVQELNLDSAVTGSAAVTEGLLLVGTERGTLYCLGGK